MLVVPLVGVVQGMTVRPVAVVVRMLMVVAVFVPVVVPMPVGVGVDVGVLVGVGGAVGVGMLVDMGVFVFVRMLMDDVLPVGMSVAMDAWFVACSATAAIAHDCLLSLVLAPDAHATGQL